VLGEGPLEALVDAANYLKVGGIGQQLQLLQRVLGAPQATVAGQLCADKKRALARRGGRVHTLAAGAGRVGLRLFFYGGAPLPVTARGLQVADCGW
jgi:hypothetical protein